jgi:hypothetical protein
MNLRVQRLEYPVIGSGFLPSGRHRADVTTGGQITAVLMDEKQATV